jgi:NAD(P)-dependent dehydrogenase (short-subunit alcohol dehydrogenase family)
MDRVVAITGASAGIGRATALRLARDRASIAICARRADPLEETAQEVERLGGRALAVVADVTREADMQALVERTVERFGRLDAMICNAGFGLYGSIDRIDGARMRRVLDVNFMGTYHAARAALPVFRRQHRGHLIVVSSIVGRRGIPYMGAYAATKFAQTGLAECLRAELAGSGIDVTTVFPVSTDTEFFEVMTRESGWSTRATGPRQSAGEVADAIASVLDRPVPELYPHRKSRALAVLAVVAPAFSDRLVQRWSRKPIEP